MASSELMAEQSEIFISEGNKLVNRRVGLANLNAERNSPLRFFSIDQCLFIINNALTLEPFIAFSRGVGRKWNEIQLRVLKRGDSRENPETSREQFASKVLVFSCLGRDEIQKLRLRANVPKSFRVNQPLSRFPILNSSSLRREWQNWKNWKVRNEELVREGRQQNVPFLAIVDSVASWTKFESCEELLNATGNCKGTDCSWRRESRWEKCERISKAPNIFPGPAQYWPPKRTTALASTLWEMDS